MKKILSVLCIISLIFSLSLICSAAGDFTVTVGSAEITEGDTSVSVSINIANNPGVAMMRFNVGYDSNALTLASVDAGEIFAASEIIAAPIANNPYTVNAAYYSGNKTNDGTIVTLNFTINDGVGAGDYAITLSSAESYSIDEDLYTPVLVNGKVTVKGEETPETKYVYGDVNDDGKVTLEDAVIISRHIADWPGYETLPLK